MPFRLLVSVDTMTGFIRSDFVSGPTESWKYPFKIINAGLEELLLSPFIV